jgi:HJR/Mrr/RecB family endonuclease
LFGGALFLAILIGLTALGIAIPLQYLVALAIPELASATRIKLYSAATAAFDEWWTRTQSDFWKSLSGLAFERELAALFNRIGWEAYPTVASGDGGIDVELYREGQRTIVQCKARTRPVGPAAARELYGALAASGARSAMLASLSGFSPAARDFARLHSIELIDLEWIIQQQKALEAGRRPSSVT